MLAGELKPGDRFVCVGSADADAPYRICLENDGSPTGIKWTFPGREGAFWSHMGHLVPVQELCRWEDLSADEQVILADLREDVGSYTSAYDSLERKGLVSDGRTTGLGMDVLHQADVAGHILWRAGWRRR